MTKNLFFTKLHTTRTEVVGTSRHLRVVCWVGPLNSAHASVVFDWTIGGQDLEYSAHPTVEIANGHFLVIAPVISLLTAFTGRFLSSTSIEPDEFTDYLCTELGFEYHG